ncbi:uncharacterized protein VNE69_02281 [Vairimorpha necatrix]|uniref:Membrane protein n=1 Tax=Vairimorpha necatrix TaxID=6039 RepID=A0AAX4JA38_9MICR
MRNLLDMDVKKLLPLITIGNVFNTLSNLHDQGIEANVESMFIPGFIISFGGPLIGNIIYRQFSFSPDLLVVFFVTLLIFSQLHKFKILKKIGKILPIIGTSLFYVSLKNNTENLTNVISYLIVSDVFSKIFSKILLNSELIYTKKDLRFFIINLGLISAFKIHKVPDYFVFAIMFCYLLIPHLTFDFKKEKKPEKKVKDVPVNQSPKKNRKVRKSSIVNLGQ